jgi:Tfp pilus assembly protein PilN
VRIGLASSRVVVRRLELPAVLKGSELETAVRFQAGDALPGALDELVLDHRALDPEGDKRRVVLAAVRGEIVGRWRAAVTLAGLKLEGVDLAGFALARALAAEVDPDAGHSTLLVHVDEVSTMAIVERGACVFARSTASGADAAAEARSTLDFHAGAPGALPLGRVVLSGAIDDWDSVEAAFDQQFGAPVLRDRGASGEAERTLIASALARPDRGAVAVDLRPDTPAERTRRSGVSPARRALVPALGLAVALLAGASALYVSASNSASTRQRQADELQAQATQVTAQANSLQRYVDLATLRASREAAVRQIAGGRLDWAGILRDVARLTPTNVDLTSLRATVAPSVSVSGSGTGAGGGGSTLRGARTSPAVELTGCAPSHPAVSHMLGQMSKVQGVTLVSLSGSARLSKSAGSNGGGDCRNGDDRRSLFQMTLFLEKATPVLPPDAGATAVPTAAPATPSTATPTSSGSSK